MDYKDVLRKVGWPVELLTMDFETYWDQDYTLSKRSEWPTVKYVLSDKFEATGLGARGRGRSIFFAPEHIQSSIDNLKIKFGEHLEELVVVVQNSFFDMLIFLHHYGLRPKYILDTKQLASFIEARASHSLRDMAEDYGLPAKGDTKQFKGLRWSKMSFEQQEELRRYCQNDVELTETLVKRMLPMITNPELELPLMNHTTQLFLQKNLRFDFELADEIKAKMEVQADEVAKELGHTRDEISGNKSFLALMKKALPPKEQVPMKMGGGKKPKLIPAFAKDDEGMKALLDHSVDAVRKLAEARLAVKSWPLHVKRVHNMTEQAKADGGYFRVPLKYAGAHTIRWSGCEGVNAQNFGSKADPLINRVRNLLMAPEGMVLITGDSSAIEARGLAWIAEQLDLIKAFAGGRDVYSEFATMLLGKFVRKAEKWDPEPVAKVLTVGRNYGKAHILGSGYGMGAKRMLAEMRKNPAFAEKFARGEIDIGTCKKDIRFYRQTFPMIPAFWGKVEAAFKTVTKFSDQVRTVGPLVFFAKGPVVHLRLPSGRELRYPRCKVLRKDNSIKWKYGKLWGGSITENIVQSMCRDLLGFWILECEKAGLPVILHVHDDLTTMVPEAEVEEKQALLEQIMLTKPAWAEGLPLAIESHTGTRYEKG
jgi:DNA polymerase